MKPKKGDTVYWTTTENNLFQNCLPITINPVIRIHKGKVISVKPHSAYIVETFINKHFLDNFEGVFTNIKILNPKAKTGLFKAHISVGAFELYSLNEIKVEVIKQILDEYEYL